ncbi:MAG: hypothetical protein K1X51_09665 [Rhodospirillaceae bacterium]|nr:hypothetical protein [Rhodospirillaceae bacterium]
MSLGRVLVWAILAAVVGGGLYFLMAGDDVPEAAVPAAVSRAPVLAPAPMPDPVPAAGTVSPGDALAVEAAEAEEKIKREQAEEIRAMPAPPPDMGMTDKAGIEKDAEEAAKAAKKP